MTEERLKEIEELQPFAFIGREILPELIAEVRRLREALKCYSDLTVEVSSPGGVGWADWKDFGGIARAALEEKCQK